MQVTDPEHIPTLSNTSQLATAPSTGLSLASRGAPPPPPPPSMPSLRLHASSVRESSEGQAEARARSCSWDSELWRPREQSWCWASASRQPDTMEAFTQRCCLWHSEARLPPPYPPPGAGLDATAAAPGWRDQRHKEKGRRRR